SAQPFGAGLDPQHVRRPAAARQPPARPPRAAGGRVVSAGTASGAQPGARPGGLADAFHRGLSFRSVPPFVYKRVFRCPLKRAVVYKRVLSGIRGWERPDRILFARSLRGGGGMADALVSGASDRKVVEVQLLSAAPPTSTDRDRRPKAVSSTAPAATSAIRSARRRPNRSAAEPISHGPMIEPPYPAAVTTIRAVPVRPRFAPALKASGTITAQPAPTSVNPAIAVTGSGSATARATPIIETTPPSAATTGALVRAVRRSAVKRTTAIAIENVTATPAATASVVLP